MSRHALPSAVRKNLGAFGETGTAWAAGFDAGLTQLERRWGIVVEEPFAALSYNFVAPVTRGHERLVLKFGVPNQELTSEIEALRAFEGKGIVRLLDADPTAGAMLLERVEPGRMLSEVRDDDRAMAIAADLVMRLWCRPPAEHGFRSVRRWFRSLSTLCEVEDVEPIPRHLLDRANRTFERLASEAGEAKLLHADFHQFNVLQRADESWVVIDPKGGVGDPGFDLGPLLINLPPDCEDPAARMAHRASRLSIETGYDRRRILEWTFARAMLGLAWTRESGSKSLRRGIGCALFVAEALDASS